MKKIGDVQLDFDDVLIKPRPSSLSSRKDVCVEKSLAGVQGVGIIAANMDTIGTFAMAETLKKYKCFTALHKYYSSDEVINYLQNTENNEFVYVTSGIRKGEFERLERIMKSQDSCKNICIDVANGYMRSFCDFIVKVAKMFPNYNIMAGNVVDLEGTRNIIYSGANIVKLGIGPGAQCLTRNKTGVGRPQLSTILDCAEYIHFCKKFVVADGGIRSAGDFVKALGAGADFVMIGSLLGGSDESAGKLVEKDGIKYKTIYGMSSHTAQLNHGGKVESYKASEGRVSLIEASGSAGNTINDLVGGLRSAMTYTDTKDIKDFYKNVYFYAKHR